MKQPSLVGQHAAKPQVKADGNHEVCCLLNMYVLKVMLQAKKRTCTLDSVS